MAITLNHTIVPCFDKVESAKFYSRVFGFEYIGAFSHFIVVRVNDTLCLDFDNKETFTSIHYAFKVSEQEFDDIFERIKAENIKYGSGPGTADDMAINHNYGGRGVYFRDPNGHLLEILTMDYVIPPQ
ncbi:VOC family protein [Nitrosomonas mobilis]|uniref:Glyoxalase/bleomycin resistance protein/dioxygenase n=1 Tax=Nitrosomonas mobilis TaxID=51642 RepID=A0A1G5SFB4_9PROT|nr:VOC family protein [Nitrosomonas mobilis]SCZ85893.1 Glyoxalase/bleomycin resistance protein/dioxygenase [Nitrosomonas mobilis]HNO75049.1 VOC family protein [Nitrosomonas mobilis]